MVNELGQLQRLPSVWEEHIWVPGFVHDEVPIDGVVIRVLVIDFFKSAVLKAKGDVLFGQVISQCTRVVLQIASGVFCGMEGGVKAKLLHLRMEMCHDAIAAWRIFEAVEHQAVAAITDGSLSRRFALCAIFNLRQRIPVASKVTHGVSQQPRLGRNGTWGGPSGPSIIGKSGLVPQISSVDRGPGPIVSNANQQGFVPKPCDTVRRERRPTLEGHSVAIQPRFWIKA